MKYLNETGLSYLWNNKLKPKFAELTNKTDQLSNPNLLINGDFQVNQRGQSSYTNTNGWNGNYTLDRWFIFGNANEISVTKNEDGTITVKNTGSGNCYFTQFLEDTLSLRDYTLSTRVINIVGNVMMYFEGIDTKYGIYLVEGYKSITTNGKPLGASFLMQPNSSITLEYVKLEQGSIATPSIHRIYSEELLLCQRYFEVKEIPVLPRYEYVSSYGYFCGITFSEKRVIPTITLANENLTSFGCGGVKKRCITYFSAKTESTSISDGFVYIDSEIYRS